MRGVDDATRAPRALRQRRPVTTLPRWAAVAALVAVALEVLVSIALQFGVNLPLWLDEALTVNIASLPIRSIPGALRHDGAPPLFYVLLHWWMGVAGHSAVAVRALPGVFAVATLVVTAVVVRRRWSTEIAAITTALLAASPYFVYYASECRMYSLVMLESVLLLWALTAATEGSGRGPLVGVALATAALLYTHYWSTYLLAILGLWFLVRAGSTASDTRRRARQVLVAMATGGVAFLPWVPSFLYQAAHTGTPWSAPTTPSIVVELFGWLTYNQAALFQVDSLHSQVLLVAYLAFAALGITSVASSRFTSELDFTVQPRARLVAAWAVGTVAVGSALSVLSSSAVTPRYAAVAFIPFIILLALGVSSFGDAWLRVALTALIATMGLWAAKEYRTTARTQSPPVAAALDASAHRGDVVVFCPDQLAPSTLRILHRRDLVLEGYPNVSVSDGRIDWVDYEAKISRRAPSAAAADAVAAAGPKGTVWLVSQTYAPGLHGRCDDLASALAALRGTSATSTVVAADIHRYYQPMQLLMFPPASSNRH